MGCWGKFWYCFDGVRCTGKVYGGDGVFGGKGVMIGQFKSCIIDDISVTDAKSAPHLEKIILEYLVNNSKRRAFWSLNEDILKIIDSDYQYAISIKEDMAYPSDHKDENEHIEKVLEIVDLFHIPNITIDKVMLRAFHMSFIGATTADEKIAIQEMAEYSQKWHNEKSRSTETSDGLVAIQAQLKSLGREIKNVNKKSMLLKLDANNAKDPITPKIAHSKKKERPLRKLTTRNLVDFFKEGD
nr:hypothetical protein [Tanacetum cinerariifolium]